MEVVELVHKVDALIDFHILYQTKLIFSAKAVRSQTAGKQYEANEESFGNFRRSFKT